MYIIEGEVKIGISESDLRDIVEMWEEEDKEDLLKRLDNKEVSIREIIELCLMYGEVLE